MSNRPQSVPRYRLHKSSGRAIVTLPDGFGARRDFYLGKFGSPESREEYGRLVREWETSGRQILSRQRSGPQDGLTLNELMLAYVRYADGYYVKDGEPTGEAAVIKLALRFLKPYGFQLVGDFGPLSLRAVQGAMIDHGLSRGTINRQVSRIRGMFKWGVGRELVRVDTLQRLQCVEGLRRGKTAAKEKERVKPVSTAVVNSTLAKLPPTVADMVKVQRLTGCRPGELLTMKAVEIDRTGRIWEYRPGRHKSEHRDRDRVIFIGPQAQRILKKYLTLDLTRPLFSPAVSEEERNLGRRAGRKTPLTPTARARRAQQNPRGQGGDQYDVDTYRRAIARACEMAKVDPWAPNQLRHSAATEVRKRYGLEAAQAVLGHAELGVTQVYAEKDMETARRVMAEIG